MLCDYLTEKGDLVLIVPFGQIVDLCYDVDLWMGPLEVISCGRRKPRRWSLSDWDSRRTCSSNNDIKKEEETGGNKTKGEEEEEKQ